MADKTRISPTVCAMPDEKNENLHIEVELPGVEKKDIVLSMHEDGFFIQASRDDLEFVGSYAVCCPIDTDKAKAKYNNGLLSIDVPSMKPRERAKKIPVQ
jgi:HSP20 family molecular chaperone IbpA